MFSAACRKSLFDCVSDCLLITCEHGGNRIPSPYRHLFDSDCDRALLDSHRGFDTGALTMAKELAERLSAPLVLSTVSRLLVDLNRSLSHPQVYSPATRTVSEAVRNRIADDYYRPYRSQAETLIRERVAQGYRVIHVSCHSFTPVLDGEMRNADIGLLYDPARSGELDFCQRWRTTLKDQAPELRVRRNYPYAGKNDGFTTSLRRCHSPSQYLGIELELNQRHVVNPDHDWALLRHTVIESLRIACADFSRLSSQ
jgi:predicted N-formylglutamate amidohydrolase